MPYSPISPLPSSVRVSFIWGGGGGLVTCQIPLPLEIMLTICFQLRVIGCNEYKTETQHKEYNVFEVTI